MCHGYCGADLTLADIVTAVERLKRQSGGARAATKLHLQVVVRNPKHRLMSHIAAAETSWEEEVWMFILTNQQLDDLTACV